MAISFNEIPGALRVPFTYVEFDNSKAQQGPSIQKYTALVVGQKIAAGSATPLTLATITSEAQARQLYGAGSMLHGMLSTYLANDKITEIKAISMVDDVAGVAATGEVIFTGPATANGVLYFYVAGRKVSVVVESGDTATQICAAFVAAIQADPLLYVSAVVDGVDAFQANLTAKNDGTPGNQIDLRFNYLDGETLPAGVGATITAMAGGANDVDIADVIAALPETQYNVIVHPYTDATNLTALENELSDRWGPIRQNDGVAFTAKIDTLGNLTTLGNGRNSQHNSIMGAVGPSAPWEWASAYGAQVCKSAQADPAKPFQTLPMIGILAPKESDQWTLTERNNLLFDGIATHKVESGAVRIERAITTWQTNAAGGADSSYLDVNTLLTLSYLRFSFRNRIQAKYGRHKLASDGTRFGPGQQVITPIIGRAEAIALFAEWETAGLVEGLNQFKRDLIVERNASDPNRLDFLLPADLINQLTVVGTKIEFLL